MKALDLNCFPLGRVPLQKYWYTQCLPLVIYKECPSVKLLGITEMPLFDSGISPCFKNDQFGGVALLHVIFPTSFLCNACLGGMIIPYFKSAHTS